MLLKLVQRQALKGGREGNSLGAPEFSIQNVRIKDIQPKC